MLKGILLAASTAVLAATGYVGMSAVTSDTAAAGRGFGCVTNPARCNNQLNTPDTFGERRRAAATQKAPARKKGKKK